MHVFCVDLTGEYRRRLSAHEPVSMQPSSEFVQNLRQLLDDVESGEFGGYKEKGWLQKLMTDIRESVTPELDAFLLGSDLRVGILDLPEITNSRIGLRLAEVYLSSVFEWARNHRQQRKILVVLEEAHSIAPERSMFGNDKGETQAVVERISQLALQGRKYGVGILVASQRTALISKTVLSQCATIIAHKLVDQTSLSYLENVFGSRYVELVPKLKHRFAVGFGPGILSENPVVIEFPLSEAKLNASRALDDVGEAVSTEAPIDEGVADEEPADTSWDDCEIDESDLPF